MTTLSRRAAIYDLPARYGAVLLCAFLLVTGLLLKNRWAASVVVVYAAAPGAATIVGTIAIVHAQSRLSLLRPPTESGP